MQEYNRIFLIMLLSILASFVLLPWIINILYNLKIQKIKLENIKDGVIDNNLMVKLHNHKAGTPVGGGLIWFILFPTLSFLVLGVNNVTVVLNVFTLLIGLLGLFDDSKRLFKFDIDFKVDALIRNIKFLYQWIWAFAASTSIYFMLNIHGFGQSPLPFFTDLINNLPWFIFIPVLSFILVSYLNAFNINDGLDGLLTGQAIWIFLGLLFLCFITNSTDVAALSSIMIGILVGFLYFNVNPARVFMGDVGSTTLGFIGVFLSLISGLFIPFIIFTIPSIVITGSSALQIFWVKVFKKKLFTIAPIHHAFEAKGWPETKVTQRFWLFQMIFVFIGLYIATLKF